MGRITITILALLSMALIIVCISLPWLQAYLAPVLNAVQSNTLLQTIMIGVGIIFVGLNLALIISMWGGRRYHINCHTPDGRVQISLGVIKEVASRIGSKVKGVQYLNVQVEQHKEEDVTVIFHLKVVVDGESPIKDLTLKLQQEIKLQVENICGVLVKEVIVSVVRTDNS